MIVKELKEKIIKISNSEFPLIDFFNDIGWLDDRHFNTEKAYEDIEKIYNVFMFYINKCKKLEKELKQTKLNFKNSQTHSKNCYKKLKEKFERGKEVYHRNYELIQENGKLKQAVKTWNENGGKLLRENTKLKQAIKILKDKIEFEDLGEMQSGNVYRGYFNDCLDEEEYDILKEVFESVGEE